MSTQFACISYFRWGEKTGVTHNRKSFSSSLQPLASMANICEDNTLCWFSTSNGNCIQVKFMHDGCGVRIKGEPVPCSLNVLPCCLKQRSLEVPKGFVTHDHCPILTRQQQGSPYLQVLLFYWYPLLLFLGASFLKWLWEAGHIYKSTSWFLSFFKFRYILLVLAADNKGLHIP